MRRSETPQNASKIMLSIGHRDFRPKHAEYIENRVFDRKSRCSSRTHKMHRKSSFRSEIWIFTQNTQNAPKIEFSIGNQNVRPEHAKYTENRVFDRISRFSPQTRRMHRNSSFRPECTENTVFDRARVCSTKTTGIHRKDSFRPGNHNFLAKRADRTLSIESPQARCVFENAACLWGFAIKRVADPLGKQAC